MERINVAVRARPLSPEDAKTSPWRISGNSINFTHQQAKFEFDRIFGEECKTAEVYESRTKDIVAAAVRGFNGTVFAYGQTNSGKTHTMRGSASEPGVIPLSVRDLFEMIHQETDREFLMRMSYMEIYNEEINDLLAPEHRKLQIHESIDRGIFVAGLREEIVSCPRQVLEFMEFGEAHRHIGETNMNLYSSRSHTIFRMIIESRERTEDESMESSCDAVRVSVLNLVDLAGSERAAKTGAEGVRLKEGSHINKSLMTLGTVIKKLSEGAESQGSHVPYRDSKLTRILQPALGGNANTAIICNITLAQIHADETKSSLQFASRALQVTNCVHVNEILTDAALLKRQKKEIEELRAKLQGSHSEHLGEEILNLRNTLLQSELERERIALELEEEKKAHAEREKRLLEQAKKIENLSSMVLCSNRDETRDHHKKEKRRDTWCPGNIPNQTICQLSSTVLHKTSAMKSNGPDRDTKSLVPFQELVSDDVISESCKKEADSFTVDNSRLPNPISLLHVTSRRKAPVRKRSFPVENTELTEMRAAYEELLIEFEKQRTLSEIQVDYLTRRIAELSFNLDDKSKDDAAYLANRSSNQLTIDKRSKDLEAIVVIKQLQEKISTLEVEKCSNLQNLDSVVELATEQNKSAREKSDELYRELVAAQEEVKAVHKQITFMDDCSESLTKASIDVQEIMLEVQQSRNHIESLSSFIDDLFKSFSALLKVFVDFRSLGSRNSSQIKALVDTHKNLHSCMKEKINELEKEKLQLHNQSEDLHNKLEEVTLNRQNAEKSLMELSEQHERETSELLSEIRTLEGELSSLSSCALAKEKEIMRKDLEKTRAKLRETESKLRNSIQEKTKLEGEKVCAEREIKFLHGQKVILERDRSKHDSVAGKRRDSLLDRSSNVFESKKGRGFAVSVDQEDYRKLEVLAFEMETTIASLEEKLVVANEDKEQAILRTESLALEVEALSKKLHTSAVELSTLKELTSSLSIDLEESRSRNQNVESSINLLVEEKEEIAMQLADSLLNMEEERAIWSARERASIEAIENRSKSYIAEIALLSKAMSEGNVINNKEKTKLRMRLRGAQAKLDNLRDRYKEAMNEIDFMNRQYEAATTKMKAQLASYGVEVLNLKKQLALCKQP